MSVTYKDGAGNEVKLSRGIVVKYLVEGDAGRLTEREVDRFINFCKYQRLNPWLREVYLIKHGNGAAKTMVGKDVHMKRASKHVDYDGLELGDPVYENSPGGVAELMSVRCKVFRKSMSHAAGDSGIVLYEEYVQKKGGKPNYMWGSKPLTMLYKVAKAQALRDAFPEELSQLYVPEELGEDEAPTATIEPPADDVPNEVVTVAEEHFDESE